MNLELQRSLATVAQSAEDQGGLGGGTLVIVGLGLVLFFVLAPGMMRIVPVTRAQRGWLERAGPVLGAVALLIYLLAVFRALGDWKVGGLSWVMLGLAAGVIAASWFVLRDLIAGIVLRAGRECRVGDTVRIAGTQGRVRRLGLRVMVVETDIGEEAQVPYSKIAGEAVVRSASVGGVARHRFSIDLVADVSMTAMIGVVRESAWQSHWSCLGREPQVSITGPRRLEVTVFSISVDHAPEIEASVRRTLGRRADRDLGELDEPGRKPGEAQDGASRA